MEPATTSTETLAEAAASATAALSSPSKICNNKMSIESFPIMYFNMAGEMIYIIDQRLTAQNVDPTKANKVINDITMAVFNQKLISEVYRPHSTITFAVLRSIFEKLAHSSIMRLNEASMNKLFDLMIMVVKYQLFACPRASDLIVITDNHLTSIIELVKCGQQQQPQLGEVAASLVSSVRDQFLLHYHSSDLLTLQLIRYSLLNFLKDIHTRVSIFLREGIQTNDGRFVIPIDNVCVECECQVPGMIRYFDADGKIFQTQQFEVLGSYYVDEQRTTLGLNIYRKESSPIKSKETSPIPTIATTSGGANTQQEINLLAKLICKPTSEEQGQINDEDLKFEFLEQFNNNFKQNITENNTAVEEQNILQFGTEESSKLLEIINDLNSLDIGSGENHPNDQNTEEEDDFLQLMDS